MVSAAGLSERPARDAPLRRHLLNHGCRVSECLTLTMERQDVPPVSAVFLVVFDQKVGYVTTSIAYICNG